MATKTGELRPFPNGTSYDIWASHNCYRCKKYDFNEETYSSSCPIAEAIADHACGELLTREMATRMGFLDKKGKEVGRDCTERVIGRPEPKTPPPPLPMDQQMKKAGMPTLPGFEVA